jgi:hypothetical protein
MKQVEMFPKSEFSARYQAQIKLQEETELIRQDKRGALKNAKDISGQKFGKLTIKAKTDKRHNNAVVWLAECECGNVIEVTTHYLNRSNGPTTHCGCMGAGRGRAKIYKGGIFQDNRATNNKWTAFKALLATYRNSATKRGRQWLLSDEEFLELVASDCHYCGVEPRMVFVRKPHRFIYNGVDRVDSNGDYVLSNCVPCCGVCNTAKKEQSPGEFIAWVNRIYNYQTKEKMT